MSIQDFSSVQFYVALDSDTEQQMGSFKTQTSGELTYIRSFFYVHGTLTGTERVRIKIYSDSSYSNVLYTSSWSTLPYSQWLGWIRFDFTGQNINKNITYYAAAEIDNYTRNGDTFYVAISYDFPAPVYDNLEDMFDKHPLTMQIFCRVD